MFESAGALAILQPVLTLVALIALPALAAFVSLLSRPKMRRPRPQDESLIAPIVSMTSAVGTLGLAIVMAVRLALMPRGVLLFQHVAQLVRLGQLDLTLDLTLDPRGATLAVTVALIGCASTLHTALSSRPNVCVKLAWTGFMTAGAMLLVVGDGLAPILVGVGALSVGGWGLSRGGDSTPVTITIAGNVAIFLGLVFLFWSLGGAFGPEGYDPDSSPRFVLVTVPPRGNESPDQATLIMTSHAGAQVSADHADLPAEPLTAPFAVSVNPGVYTLRVQGGTASADVVIPRVALLAGRTHVLSPYGPTASLHVLDDQIAVPRLMPSGGALSVRAILTARTIGGLRASAIVLFLVLGGALAHVHALAFRRGHSTLVLIFEGLLAPYFALRLAPLAPPGVADGVLVALLGAASALILAANAACVDDGHRALRGALATACAVAVVAVGLGDPSAALILATSGMVSTAAALAAIDARRDIRWLGVACSALIGLFPGAGASAGYILTIAAALRSAMESTLAWAIFAGVIAIGVAGAVALASLAAFRVYDAVIRASVRQPGTSRGQGALVVGLSVVALVGGTALGAGTTLFGGAAAPLAQRLSGATSVAPPRGVALSALFLTVAAAALGVGLARRVSAASTTPLWLLTLGRPYAVLGRTTEMLGHAAEFLQRSAMALDREVIEDIPVAMGDLVRLVRRRGSEDEPSPEANGVSRLHSITRLVMMAVLAAIVLSSFFLR